MTRVSSTGRDLIAGTRRRFWRGPASVYALALALWLPADARGQVASRPTTASAQTRPASAPATSPTTAPTRENDLENIDLLSLEIPTVVTATRREQSVTTVPYAVSVITAEDIRLSGARSVPDALRQAAGVDVAELTYGNYAVSPRGQHSLYASKTLVLVDGRQVYDTLFGGTAWMNWPFQLEDIERIEVIRGPAGVAWGAGAVNGVINIITKDPREQLGLTATGAGGSRSTHKEHTGYAFETGKLRLRVSGEMEGSDGFLRPNTRMPLDGFRDKYEGFRGGTHAIYDAGPKDTLTLSGGSAVIRGNAPVPRTTDLRIRSGESQSNYLLGKWQHEVEKDNTFELTGYVNDYYNVAGAFWSEYRYQQFALQAGNTFKPAENHTLTWGVDTRWDLTSAANGDPPMLSQSVVRSGDIGLYVQDDWRFAPRWMLSLGGRVDYDCYGGFEPSGRASLSYELTDTSLVYAAVSRAFNMPPAAKRFVDFPITGGILELKYDRDIDAESVVAYELGYRGRFLDRLDVNVAAYWNCYDDLMVNTSYRRKSVLPPFVTIISDNGLGRSIYGVEFDARYALATNLMLLGNYTFQMPDTGSYASIGTDCISPPRNKFMFGIRYSPLPELHLSSYLYYVDICSAAFASKMSKYASIDSYLRWDLRAEYEFWKDRASVAVGVRNLQDNLHPEGATASMDTGEVPRMVYAEMRMTLK